MEPVSKCYGWPGSEYDDLSIADVADSLTKVFLQRNPHLKTTGGASVLRYGSRALAPEERAADLLLQCRGGTIGGGLYSENVMLLLDLAPSIPERVPSKEDIIDDLAAKLSDSIIAEVSQEDVGGSGY